MCAVCSRSSRLQHARQSCEPAPHHICVNRHIDSGRKSWTNNPNNQPTKKTHWVDTRRHTTTTNGGRERVKLPNTQAAATRRPEFKISADNCGTQRFLRRRKMQWLHRSGQPTNTGCGLTIAVLLWTCSVLMVFGVPQPRPAEQHSHAGRSTLLQHIMSTILCDVISVACRVVVQSKRLYRLSTHRSIRRVPHRIHARSDECAHTCVCV